MRARLARQLARCSRTLESLLEVKTLALLPLPVLLQQIGQELSVDCVGNISEEGLRFSAARLRSDLG